MQDNQEMLELLRKIEKSNRQKTVTNILLCLFMLAAAVSCVTLCVMVCRLLPQVNGLLGQMEAVMGDLEQTARNLAGLDMEAMAGNVNSLAVFAQDSLQQTMKKLESIDLETMNKAIEDLAKIIKPLAEFFGRFD